MSILAIITNIGILTVRNSIFAGDIKTTRQILNEVSGRNERAKKFLGMMNRVIPDSIFSDGDINVPYSDIVADELTCTYDTFHSLQVDEWARVFWPSIS